jgi:potassium-dependent mechanosensitive channel
MDESLTPLQQFFSRNIQLGENTLPVTWQQLLFGLVLPIVVIYLGTRLVMFFVKRLVAKSQLKDTTKKGLLRWIRIGYRLGYLVAFGLLVARLLGDQITEGLGSVFVFLSEPFFESGNTQISVVTLLLLIPIFYVASWAGNATRRVLERGVLERLNLDASRRFSVTSLLRYGVAALVVMIGLSVVGINLSSLAVIFGVLGIGLGFGLQGIVANFFAGMIIIISRPIKEGDRIHFGEMEGDVQHIRMLYSVVRTITDETLILPNRQIVENAVHNQSYDDPGITLITPVQVAYESDLDHVGRVLLSVGKRISYLRNGREPRVIFRSFDDSGITVALAVPIGDARDRYMARSEMIVEIWRAFRQAGITIPFPQRDLHVKTAPVELSVSDARALSAQIVQGSAPEVPGDAAHTGESDEV